MSVPPLTKHDGDGNRYTRPEAVEAQIASVSDLQCDEIARRCAISTRSDPEYLRSECLIHLLRKTRGDNSDGRFDRLFPLVLRRFLHALPRSERTQGEVVLVDGRLSDVNDLARSRFLTLMTIDRQGGDRLDFYEVHFDEAVALLRLTARTRVGRRAARETPMELDQETNEPTVEVERAAGSLQKDDDAFLSDPGFRSRVLAAIDSLPREQREVMTMLMNNFQIQSNDRDVPSISRITGCDARTVQNRRTRAIAEIRRMIGLGAEG
ncbi:hypothetical protein [Tardiphaga sp. OK245]|jgi:hypothetical protein|uniref:hypothetical protein n=1 Tax=Tardiphaga sp. OK245 TaxID=1855306 RepID=UPI0008A74682|nr:hypothetical protein [Tardiphaga sp. OK245]SEH87427.1 hypothetical protein SAMN05216367_2472 [Tardiphaga sp. OK245]